MKIIQEHQKCIGCGSCAAICPKFWEMIEGGKARPIGAELKGENYELESGENGCNQEAADACPVQCIRIEK
jgi:ferredoxin